MESTGSGQTRFEFLVLSRSLIGYSNEFMLQTADYGVMNCTFGSYKSVAKNWEPGRRSGALVSISQGQSTTYSFQSAEQRDELLIGAGAEVYEGMVVGQSSRERDIAANATRGRDLTNTRATGKDHSASIRAPKAMALEEAIKSLNDDEYCEVTPESIRLRKKILDTNERKKTDKRHNKWLDSYLIF